MRSTVLILLTCCIVIGADAQFTVKDLLELSVMSPKYIEHFMVKNNFFLSRYQNEFGGKNYMQVYKHHKADTLPREIVDLYQKDNSAYFVLHTYSVEKYSEGWDRLIKAGYHCATKQDRTKDSLSLFQKANVTIEVGWQTIDSNKCYCFKLRLRNVPDSVAYAEDLLQFSTHDFLVSYFGRNNVTDDLYYFSDTELKKCSVLFMGSNHQAAFIWDDQDNLDHLSYIVVSNVMPTKISDQRGIPDATNEWKFKSGLYWGMNLREMLRLNDMDFYVYGNKSEFSFMVKPEITGKLDFKKTSILLKCDDCYGNQLFDQKEVSALDIAKANIPVRVFDIILYP